MASLRHGLIPTAALVFVFALAQVRAGAQGKAAACPLTDAQTQKSIDAWSPIAAFFTGEPRCFNCHGGVNPYISGTGLEPARPGQPPSTLAHGGGLVQRGTDGTIEAECRDCHNHMPNGRGPWMTAPEFLSFVNKDATTLCRQMKRRFSNANDFLGHLENDNGGIPFAEAGFIGDRALDPDVYSDLVPPAPPSKSHAELMQMARNWVSAMGGSFKGDEGCGCEYRHANWSGQIHYTYQYSGDVGHDDLQDWSVSEVAQITFTFKDGVGTVTSHGEFKSHAVNRRGIVRNGQASLILDNSSDGYASVSLSSQATVDVQVNEARGTYDVRTGWPPQVGIQDIVQCEGQHDSGPQGCRTTQIPYTVTENGRTRIGEKFTDPNHVRGSKSDHKEEQGRSHNGVMMWTVDWDLWRSN